MKRKLVESPLGIKTTEETARKLDAILKDLPKEKAYEFRRKGMADTQVQAGEQRVDVSRVSTRRMDRDFEIVEPSGIELDDYRLNPIVLFGHDHDRPVGKALWVKADQDGLIAKTQYVTRPDGYQGEWLPDFVWGMVQQNVLTGKSIGFLPLEVREPEPAEVGAQPSLQAVITRSLLLEYSVVSVPANPAALVESIGKGMDLSAWNFKVLGKVRKPKPASPQIDHMKVATDRLAEVRLDPARIAEMALERLAKRWEV
jgi:HK97 family phage prohead protease